MNTYEVFLKKAGKEPFSHAGSLDAPDDELAVAYARETYGRRSEGEQMWVVDRSAVLVGDKNDLALADRDHRHNDGHLVAELRQSDRGHAR
jgi:ring-1,2-phenylacetyl-CoA epoxidase subunit PaaB|tara:strand:- start:296 stop:568 length:273 start_codon:yes stop_codon:yes gene_type:complete